MVPPGWKVDGERILTYLEAILQEKFPKSVVVIGSGAIGVECATIWNSYGAEVTIVEMLPNLVPLEDEEVSAELASFKSRDKVLTVGSDHRGYRRRRAPGFQRGR
jgi:dihydrolipoamide dehydrogenase